MTKAWWPTPGPEPGSTDTGVPADAIARDCPAPGSRIPDGDASVLPGTAASAADALDLAMLADLEAAIGTDGVQEALTLFLEDAPAHGAAITRFFQADDIGALRREAHAMAGIAKAVGVMRLAAVAVHLQHAAETTQPDQDSVTQMEARLTEAEAAIRAWLDRPSCRASARPGDRAG